MHVHRTRDTAAATSRRRQRAVSVELHVQRLVVRFQHSHVGRVHGHRGVGCSGGHASIRDGTVVSHTEHVLGGRHRAPGDAPVFGVYTGDHVLRGSAHYAAGHRETPKPCGRRAPGVHRSAGGEVHSSAGHVPRSFVRSRQLLVVRD